MKIHNKRGEKTMAEAQETAAVKVHYTARLSDGTEKSITLDGNHPLAGRDLLLDVEMVERS